MLVLQGEIVIRAHIDGRDEAELTLQVSDPRTEGSDFAKPSFHFYIYLISNITVAAQSKCLTHVKFDRE